MPHAAPSDATLELVTRFENLFISRDLDAIMACMTDDPVFEHVAPPTASVGRHQGRERVRALFASLEECFPRYTLEVTDVIATECRAACQYTLRWRQPDGSEGQARGAEVFRIRDGKIAEKLTYVTLCSAVGQSP